MKRPNRRCMVAKNGFKLGGQARGHLPAAAPLDLGECLHRGWCPQRSRPCPTHGLGYGIAKAVSMRRRFIPIGAKG